MLSIIVAVSIIQKSYSGFRFNEVIELISNRTRTYRYLNELTTSVRQAVCYDS